VLREQQRRYDELIAKGDKVTYEAVLKNVEERDYIDSNRANSPLIKAENAIEIDNSNLTRDEQFEMVLALVNEAKKSIIFVDLILILDLRLD
jgi:cytidylate kinase